MTARSLRSAALYRRLAADVGALERAEAAGGSRAGAEGEILISRPPGVTGGQCRLARHVAVPGLVRCVASTTLLLARRRIHLTGAILTVKAPL